LNYPDNYDFIQCEKSQKGLPLKTIFIITVNTVSEAGQIQQKPKAILKIILPQALIAGYHPYHAVIGAHPYSTTQRITVAPAVGHIFAVPVEMASSTSHS